MKQTKFSKSIHNENFKGMVTRIYLSYLDVEIVVTPYLLIKIIKQIDDSKHKSAEYKRRFRK